MYNVLCHKNRAREQQLGLLGDCKFPCLVFFFFSLNQSIAEQWGGPALLPALQLVDIS